MTELESQIVAALRVAVQCYEDYAKECRASASAPAVERRPRETGPDGIVRVDITPTPAGFARIAEAMEQQATTTRQILERIEAHGLPSVLRGEPDSLREALVRIRKECHSLHWTEIRQIARDATVGE